MTASKHLRPLLQEIIFSNDFLEKGGSLEKQKGGFVTNILQFMKTQNQKPSRPVFSFAGETRLCFETAFLVQELYFKLLNHEVVKDGPVFAEASERIRISGLQIIAPRWFADCFAQAKRKAV